MCNKILYIPVEIKNREFNSRLLLASYALDAGFSVVIGDQRKLSLLLDKLPNGIYFDKSLSKNKIKRYRSLKKAGWILSSIDEEGLMSRNNKERYLSQRHCEDTLSLADMVFTWGEEEKDIILEKYHKYSEKIFSSGNPRIDLLSSEFNSEYQAQAENIAKEYGDYLLFPSSFAVNHALGKEGFFKNLENLGRISSDEEKEAYIEKNKFFSKTFEKYVYLVETVSNAYPDLKIIVRPHPSEDMAFWVERFSDIKNVEIIREGGITPWVMASKGIIHSSCTTGIEARALHKPVITYLPYTDHEYVKHISNELSVRCYTEDEVLGVLAEFLKGSTPAYDGQLGSEVNYVLSNIDEPMACKNIVLKFCDLNCLPFSGTMLSFVGLVQKKLLFNLSELKNYKTRSYRQQKFDHATLDEVLNKLKSFNVVEEPVQASKIFDDVFWLRT